MSAGADNADAPEFRTLLLQADDFGLNEPVTRGILHAFEQGVLTSTSAMTNSPFFSQAMMFWKNLEERQKTGQIPSADWRRMLGEKEISPFDFGIHLNLTQGKPLTGDRYPAGLLTRDGFFPGIGSLYFRLPGRARKYREAIFEELREQVAMARDHGVTLTHLNGHQYVELLPAVRSLIPDLMRHFGIRVCRSAVEPAVWETTISRGELDNGLLAFVKTVYARRFRRLLDQHGIVHPDCYFGISHAGRVNEVLETFLERAPTVGSTEVCLHPATEPGHHTLIPIPGWEDPLEKLRPKELKYFLSGECLGLLRKYRVRLGRFSTLPGGK